MIEDIQQRAARGGYRLTLHARQEMDAEGLSTEALLRALMAPGGEVIEDYPDDPRGHSCLALIWLDAASPLHVCCAVHEDLLVIITVYRPSEARWTQDWRRRT